MVVNKKEPPGDIGGSLWQKGMKEDFLSYRKLVLSWIFFLWNPV